MTTSSGLVLLLAVLTMIALVCFDSRAAVIVGWGLVIALFIGTCTGTINLGG